VSKVARVSRLSLPIPLVAPKRVPDPTPPTDALLDIRQLTVAFSSDIASLRVLSSVSLTVPRGGVVALMGESGSGKSVTALAALGLLAVTTSARVMAGEVWLDGRDVLKLASGELSELRGGSVGIVLQEPGAAFTPGYSVGFHLTETLRLHQRLSRGQARERAMACLAEVGLPEPRRCMNSLPHELSAGMRQRVTIAIALANDPRLVIADEPVADLDAISRQQILPLLAKSRQGVARGVLLITNDLSVVSDLAQEVVVLYAGVVVELGPTRDVLGAPSHPYTRALLASALPGGFRERARRRDKLPVVGGPFPRLGSPWHGCGFRDRCPEVLPQCTEQTPELVSTSPTSAARAVVRCFRAGAARG